MTTTFNLNGVRRRGERRGAEERKATRETCTLRCTRTRERDERRIAHGRRERATCERERESESTRKCDVAGCASYIEALE